MGYRLQKAWFTGFAVLCLSAAGLALGTGKASAAGVPLPPYPATTMLDLGTPGCVTDDVIMNDPVVTNDGISVTFGSDGVPVVISTGFTPPVTYHLWWSSDGNIWTPGPPAGVQINPNTGLISAYDGVHVLSGDIHGNSPLAGSHTYLVRDHGVDHNGDLVNGANGTEQFQVTVDNTGGPGGPTSLTYGNNDFDNANGAITIQLNPGGTALTLAVVAGSLHIPGSNPVVFTLYPAQPGWILSSTDVLTGTNASDPSFRAVTKNHDVVFFHLSGLSTDSTGHFFTNNDNNPCVRPDVLTFPNPGNQTSTVNTAIGSLVLNASSSAGEAITYSASGLPPGLAISAGGVISGTPTAQGTFSVSVTATDASNSQTVTFSWTVNPVTVTPPPPSSVVFGPGLISSFADFSASCLTATGTAPYSPLELFHCNSANSSQQWEVASIGSGGADQIRLHGTNTCVTEVNPGGAGQLVAGNCNSGNPGVKRQNVTIQFGAGNCHCGVYYRFTNGTVMDDWGFRVADGSVVGTFGFNGGRNQGWGLP